MQTTINNTAYIIEEYDAGQWFWTSAVSESGYFASACEVLQDAINFEQIKSEQSDDGDDAPYWNAYHQTFNHRDY